VPELIDYSRQHPGELNYSSGGNGSAAHIAMAAFAAAAGLDLVHVPYKGTAPGVTDLIGGRVQLTMTGGPAELPFARADKLRALAVSSATRLSSEPELPTIAEAALVGFEASQWYGTWRRLAHPRTDRATARPGLARRGGQAGQRGCRAMAHLARGVP